MVSVAALAVSTITAVSSPLLFRYSTPVPPLLLKTAEHGSSPWEQAENLHFKSNLTGVSFFNPG
jgi:hypothetical protein